MGLAFRKPIEKALQNRLNSLRLFQEEKTDCYRLFNGTGEGIPGFIVERYDSLLIFQFHEGKCSLSEAQSRDIAQFYEKELGIKSVYLKRFISDRSSSAADSSYFSEEPFWGLESPPKITCSERGMKIEVHPYEGFSTGIFLDQRNNRWFLRSEFQNKEVLNCFSYTCAFSVACAMTNNQVTSIDLSKKYLEWGKNNFVLNALKPEEHFFYAVDVFEQFKKAKKTGKSFDLIILDPPSFSRNNKGKVFSVKKDMEALVSESFELLKPGGAMFVSSNLATWSSSLLKNLVENVLRQSKLKVKWIDLPQAPLDFSGSETVLSQCCFKKTD